MRIFQDVNGGVLKSAREYDIAANTAIKEGQVVKLSAGLVVLAVAGETGAILGIAAENHSGAADALNPRANGTKIMVYDSPALVCASKVPTFAATGGSATTVTASELGAFSNDDFNGGYLKLVKKAEGSTNTDEIGTVKRITDYSYNSTGTVSTFTVESGGAAYAGDEYELYPPIGFQKGNLDANIQKLALNATAALPIKVIGRNEDMSEIYTMAALHELGSKKS